MMNLVKDLKNEYNVYNRLTFGDRNNYRNEHPFLVKFFDFFIYHSALEIVEMVGVGILIIACVIGGIHLGLLRKAALIAITASGI